MPLVAPTASPSRIGRYRITGVIGRGGMGTVYRGHDEALDREVAVKVIHERFGAAANVVRRFGEEARSVARLSSPHIVHVHEFDPFAEPPFLAMELVRGPSLQQLIRARGRGSCGAVADCGRQVLAGLAAAHAAGVVHRDVKPANVLRGLDGTYKLTDFGLARSLEREQSLTASGSIIGTLHYMAPEVAAGDEATAASDLYSLGVTLYEMLAGTTPFPEDSPLRLLRRIASERPLPIRAHRDDIPPQFEAWLEKLLARDPADRFSSAVAALEALRQFDMDPVAADEFATVDFEVQGLDDESSVSPAPRLLAETPPPIPRDQVDSIIRAALRLEAQGKSLLGDDTILAIAGELNVDSRFVRRALADHRAAAEPPPPVPVPAAAAPLDPAARQACADAIDRLWWANLVSMASLLPGVVFNIFSLIGLGMELRPLRGTLAAHGRAFSMAAGLVMPLFWMEVVWLIGGLAGLAFPAIHVVLVPLGIVILAISLRLYWTALSGAAELIEQIAAPAAAERLRAARNRGTCLTVSLVIVYGFVQSAMIGQHGAGDESQVVTLVFLAAAALLHWLFGLRPLELASRVLRDPAFFPGRTPR